MKVKNRIYLLDASINELDDIASALPKEYGARVDHRIKRDTWLFVKPEHREKARFYLRNKLYIRCVSLDISDDWY